MTIYYTTKFAREYQKLPLAIQREAEKREAIFRKNPFDQRLRTHKLKGQLSNFWSFSVTHSYRIIFQFDADENVWFHAIGDHAIYQ